MLCSLHATNSGLNITPANHVLHIDLWWNPASEDQAVDRTHRMGQTREVTVVHFVVRATIEISILKRQEHKRAMARACLYGPDGLLSPITNTNGDEFGELRAVWREYENTQWPDA